MSKVKIKTNVKAHWGKKVSIPFDGNVLLSEEGIVEVSKEAAVSLTKNGIGWNLVGKMSDSESEEEAEEVVVSEEPKKEIPKELIGQPERVVSLTEKYSFGDMKKIATEAEIDADLIKKANNKIKIANLLNDQLDEKSLEILLSVNEEEKSEE